MYRVEVPRIINQFTALFYRLRLWDSDDEGRSIATVLKFFQVIHYAFFITCNITSAAITSNMEDTVLLTDFSILTGTHAVRLVYIVWKKAEILRFIDKLGTHCTDDLEQSVRFRSQINALLKFAEILSVACCGNALLIIVFPIFTNHSIINLEFPWENTGLGFWLNHIILSLGCSYCIICFLLTIIIWYLMLCCSFKYQLLGNQFRSMGKRDTTVEKLQAYSPNEQQQQLFMEDLLKAIKDHREIHGTIDQFSSTFSIFFFIQIMTSGIAICTGVYSLAFSSHENLLVEMFNWVFSVYNFCDIFLLTYLGNEIKLSSDRLSYCLFESNWIEQSSACKRYMIIMAEVLKRPQEMVVGKLYPLNMKTFTSIANGAYSMFNVLRK